MVNTSQSVTQFVAHALGIADFPPPEPRRGPRFGAGAKCWLCGGDTAGVGWPQTLAIAPTFTQHNTAKFADSDAVCQSCAALTRAETWQGVVAAKGLQIKVWPQAGWHSYSHFVREGGHYEAPTPSRMREILLDPPSGRWVMAINTTGKKHTIFRGAVASGRSHFPVQMDEETIWTGHSMLLECLADFERLTTLGARKDDVLSGQYHPEFLRRAGLAAWWPAEERMPRWRQEEPALLALVHFVARGPKPAETSPKDADEAESSPAEAMPQPTQPATPPAKKTSSTPRKKKARIEQPGQGSLF